MNPITINLEENDTKGRAYVGEASAPQAEMTYSKASDTLLIIDHTEVSESLRGQGVGRKLLDRLVEKARAQHLTILPLCPYAKSVFAKDPSIGDVLKK